MIPGETIEDWRRLKTLSRADFASRYPHPFLLRQKLRRTTGVPTALSDDWTDRISFDTNVAQPEAILSAASPGRMRGARVVPVIKAPGNPFPDRISVGRAPNCDIPVKDPSVSKLHATFKVKNPREAEITDAKSANGTRLNGRPIEPAKAVTVRSGDLLIFGTVAVQFLDAGTLWDLL